MLLMKEVPGITSVMQVPKVSPDSKRDEEGDNRWPLDERMAYAYKEGRK